MVPAVLPHTRTHRQPVACRQLDAILNPALQADVEDDVAPAKRPTRKFKNLDKPWEDDSVDHWKQHSLGFTQYGHAGHGGGRRTSLVTRHFRLLAFEGACCAVCLLQRPRKALNGPVL